ncbi:MAG TPA: NADH:flavin oxidoreductase, partial [Myxococcota bacterium]|nr:NADH:flavin oxidoreductase [Myxococcota bacterium]
MPELSSPLSLPCGAVLSNRIAKSAMSEDLADRGNVPGERLFRLYRRWGKGGAGLLITGNVMIDRTALGEPYNVVVEDEKVLPALSAWAAAAREGGVEVWPQLNHPGRQSPRMLSPVPVAPSAVAVQLPGKAFAQPRALSSPEIEALVARFARAAALCKQAGFTGVQIHGAHGYLISQFLSPLSNLREDEWGGSPENRRRFLIEVVRAVRAAVGPTFPVGVKLNSADFQRGGFSEEESMEVVE